MEGLDIAHLFAGAGEFDGFARYRAHGQGRAAAGIAIELCQDHAVDVELIVEGLGHVDRVLTGHRVHNQQNFLRMDRFLDAGQLVHQRFIHMQATGGIDDQHIAAIVARMLHGFLHRFNRILRALFKYGHVNLLAHHLQLTDSGRTVNIAGGQQRLFAFFYQVIGQLAAHGGFTSALQAAQHINSRHRGRPGKFGVAAAHQRGQFLVYNLDNLLTGVQGGQNLRADAALGNALNKILYDHIVDVGFQQRHAHFAHGVLDILLVELALARQLFKGRLQFIRKTLKGHGVPPRRSKGEAPFPYGCAPAPHAPAAGR